MRLSLLATAAALLSASLIAHAETVTVDYSGLTGDQGGSISGNFQYDNSSTPLAGLYAITSLNLTEINGISLGGPYPYPQVPLTIYITPGFVSSVPETNGSILIGTLDMAYNSDFGPIVFDLTFNQDGSASGALALPSYGLSESFSASQVTYSTVPSTTVTPEPSSFLLLGTALLGLTSKVRQRRA
ncbi:MAG TPA: PEP-CTERM sorting domain-containing protein [Acidobacteriaceae bacterium]|nr:PEP-CTERM sorting domain-containing protein [Acidobacteriaceae bacterium]